MDLHETYLYREIHEQPDCVAALINKEHATLQSLVKSMRQRGVENVLIAARGTSDNAARYAGYVLGAMNHLMVTLALPSLFTVYRQPPHIGRSLVLGISQSGTSPDIISVLAEGRAQGALTAAITNTPDSAIVGEADFVVNLQAGPEQSLAATKTYTTQLAAIALLSAIYAGSEEKLAELERMPDILSDALSAENEIPWLANRLRYMQHCVVVGRGYNYATAHEVALKLKELTYSVAEPYSSADFLHGPVALVESGFPVIVVAPSGALQAEMKDFLGVLSERSAEIVLITDDETLANQADFTLRVPQAVPEWLSPMAAIIPGQLLAMHLAHWRRYDVDRPRGLRKVTETW